MSLQIQQSNHYVPSWGNINIPNWNKKEKIIEKQRKENNAWDIRNVLSRNAIYNIIYGERSNGKTYGVLLYGLIHYFSEGGEIAIIRRMEEDFRGKRATTMFKSLVENGVIDLLSDGEWNGVKYWSQRWFLTKTDEKGNTIVSDTPFAYAFSLSSMEHDKSTSYPNITTILFDECLTRLYYLPDEFVLFMNTISTIKRKRTNVKIFMCGNTVNKYCPYFKEMGLTNIKKQEKGTIDLYSYGDSGLTCAVEFNESPVKDKESDMYFAFDNPKLKMITDGEWEIDIYPHLPLKYLPKDVIYQYFIKFDGETLHAEIIHGFDDEHKCEILYTFIHRKTTPVKDENIYMVYQMETDVRNNYRRKITRPTSEIEKKIYSFFIRDKVFYQDNDVGELVNNYLKWCITA